jgi:hypothetical protein
MKRAGLYIRMSTAGSAPRNSIARSAPIRRPAWASHCRDLHGSRGKRDERSPSCAGQADGRCTATQIRCRGRLAVRPSGEVNQALLQVLDELNGFGIQFLSQREAIDTEGPLGRAIIVIISAIAKLELADRGNSTGRNAKGQARRLADRQSTAGHQPGASCRRSSFANVVDCCGQKARNQPGEYVSIDEGVQREFPCRSSLEVWSQHRSASFALGDYSLCGMKALASRFSSFSLMATFRATPCACASAQYAAMCSPVIKQWRTFMRIAILRRIGRWRPSPCEASL